MHPESTEKTALVTQDGQWEWLVMPMGFTNAWSSFQQMMNQLIGDLPFGKVSMDDIIVHSHTLQDHMEHLRTVMICMHEHRFYVKLWKCKFLQERMTFLGHEINAEGMHIAKFKVEAVQQGLKLHTISDVRSFLELVQFFSRSLKDYA